MSGFSYNFKKRFVAPILAGRKPHTIRAHRRDGRVPAPGDSLSLWTGQRTKQCALLLRTECVRVDNLEFIDGPGMRFTCFINGVALCDDSLTCLAIADGFTSATELRAFLIEQYGLPFCAHLIHWLPPTQSISRFH